MYGQINELIIGQYKFWNHRHKSNICAFLSMDVMLEVYIYEQWMLGKF